MRGRRGWRWVLPPYLPPHLIVSCNVRNALGSCTLLQVRQLLAGEASSDACKRTAAQVRFEVSDACVEHAVTGVSAAGLASTAMACDVSSSCGSPLLPPLSSPITDECQALLQAPCSLQHSGGMLAALLVLVVLADPSPVHTCLNLVATSFLLRSTTMTDACVSPAFTSLLQSEPSCWCDGAEASFGVLCVAAVAAVVAGSSTHARHTSLATRPSNMMMMACLSRTTP